jgi:hypothetical protein
MTAHNFGESQSAMKNQVGMIHHPNFTPEEKANMKCMGNCSSITCSFHSRMGCSIDKGYHHIPTDRFVKHSEEKMVGRYKVKKGS